MALFPRKITFDPMSSISNMSNSVGEVSNSKWKDETGPPNNRITRSSTASTGAGENCEGLLQDSDSNNATMVFFFMFSSFLETLWRSGCLHSCGKLLALGEYPAGLIPRRFSSFLRSFASRAVLLESIHVLASRGVPLRLFHTLCGPRCGQVHRALFRRAIETYVTIAGMPVMFNGTDASCGAIAFGTR